MTNPLEDCDLVRGLLPETERDRKKYKYNLVAFNGRGDPEWIAKYLPPAGRL